MRRVGDLGLLSNVRFRFFNLIVKSLETMRHGDMPGGCACWREVGYRAPSCIDKKRRKQFFAVYFADGVQGYWSEPGLVDIGLEFGDDIALFYVPVRGCCLVGLRDAFP